MPLHANVSDTSLEAVASTIAGNRGSVGTCPQCNSTDTVHKIPASPTSHAHMACFTCAVRFEYETSAAPTAPTVFAVPAAPAQPEVPAYFLALQQTVQNLSSRMSRYDEILAENASLKKTVAAMKEEMRKLRAALPGRKATTTTTTTVSTPAVRPQNPTPTPTAAAPRSWANVATTNLDRPTAGERKRATAARAFQTIEGPQGFEFIYIQRNRRMDRSDIRRRLRQIGVDTSRLLDITFPSRNTLGLLIHVQYKTALCEVLKASQITPLPAFDPLDPKHIADPKHETLSAGERKLLAADLHRERLIRGLKFMRPHVAPAVARQYVIHNWIDESDVPAQKGREPPATPFQSSSSDSDYVEDMSQEEMSEDSETDQ